MFLAFRTQTDVSSPVTDNAELYRKQTDIIQECLVELKSKREEELKHFKWFLKQEDTLKGFPGIPVAWLEKADRHDTVDLMVQKYQDSGALSVTLTILEKISRNDLMCHLQKTTSVPTGKVEEYRNIYISQRFKIHLL